MAAQTDDLLEQLLCVRDSGRLLDDHPNDLVSRCHALLLSQVHWFCERAAPAVSEAAAFLIKLYSSNDPIADEWKEHQARVIYSCHQCLENYHTRKMNCAKTYLSAHSAETARKFIATVGMSEAGVALAQLRAAPNEAQRMLVLYHVFLDLTLLRQPNISILFTSRPPTQRVLGRPPEPPPGFLLLLVDKRAETRIWARGQVTSSTPRFSRFTDVLLALIRTRPCDEPCETLSTTMTPPELWPELPGALALLWRSTAAIHLVQIPGANLRIYLSGSPDEKCTQIIDACRFFAYFQSMKDKLPVTGDSSTPQTWFNDYLKRTWDMLIFGDALAKVSAWVVEKFQDPCSDIECRVTAIAMLCEQLSPLYWDASFCWKEQRHAIEPALDALSTILLHITFEEYKDQKRKRARAATREFLACIFKVDAHTLQNASPVASSDTDEGSGRPNMENSQSIVLPIHTSLWEGAYERLSMENSEGLALLLKGVARSASLSPLCAGEVIAVSKSGVVFEYAKPLAIVRGGLVHHLRKLDITSDSAALRELMRKIESVEHLIALIFSPGTDLSEAAKTILLATSAEHQAQYFHSTFVDFPADAIKTLAGALTIFNQRASPDSQHSDVLEWAARYLTNAAEVLYLDVDMPSPKVTPDQLLEVTRLILRSLTMIFQHLHSWSVLSDPWKVATWMCDALALGGRVVAWLNAPELGGFGTSAIVSPHVDPVHQVDVVVTVALVDMLSELLSWQRTRSTLNSSNPEYQWLRALLGCSKKSRPSAMLEKSGEPSLPQVQARTSPREAEPRLNDQRGSSGSSNLSYNQQDHTSRLDKVLGAFSGFGSAESRADALKPCAWNLPRQRACMALELHRADVHGDQLVVPMTCLLVRHMDLPFC
ncbi:hypothetical protein BOTBODRAFT_47343 [Botryobasidium botryosum FD-172 SS1]|uniref:Helicase Sen1 N-terminal domain-containing protein n=1 Tax=Botryobasidium botryosum (strain FD-172 SS1) TaxID=930990 RepID=A0A067M5B0_BOTB1|nr:hypothetical protein BOTBODRAFT_47343 [Botryobasidium botryosum FD-172 SS1]